MSIESHLQYLSAISPGENSPAEIPGDHGDLPPILRALLVADGTVTLLLQAYFNEPVAIDMIEQQPVVLPVPLQVLGLSAGDTAFYRRVQLIGEESGRCYARARSLLNASRIHHGLFEELIDEKVGMGEVLRNSARGSFREVLDITRLSADEICRTYAVFVNQHPAILITESFDQSVYRDY